MPVGDAHDQIDLQQLVNGVTRVSEQSAAKSSALDGAAAVALADAMAELKALGSFRCTVMAALRFIKERVDGLRVGADRCRPGHLYVSVLTQMGYSAATSLSSGSKRAACFLATEDPVLLDGERTRISPRLRLASDRIDEAVYQLCNGWRPLAARDPSR